MKQKIGKFLRITAGIYLMVLFLIIGTALLSLLKLMIETNFEFASLLMIKVIIYSIFLLYSVYGIFGLFKNLRKSLLFSMIVIYILSIIETSFLYAYRGYFSIDLLVYTVFLIAPLFLISLSLRLESNDRSTEKLMGNIFGDSNPTAKKTLSIISLFYAVLFLLLGNGMIKIELLKTTSADELIAVVQRTSNFTLIAVILFLSYLFIYFLIKVLFKRH